MNRGTALLALVMATLPGAAAWSALIGLGMHRHGTPWAISLSATLLLFGPPLAVGGARATHRAGWTAAASCVWSTLLLLILPVYFPGERRSAVATGLAVVGLGDLARALADHLPDEPIVALPEVPEAATPLEAPALAPLTLEDHQIALPYEGEGRRLAVPVVFEHGGVTLDVEMMLDTGATYTTLPAAALATLGIHPGPDDPVVELQTANGPREASVVLVDEVWLGDIAVTGVAVATCEACAFSDTTGLLGLNVTGGFNMTIDADRREVVFSRRATVERRLDVRQFVDLSATFTTWPGGRVEIDVRLQNRASRDIAFATAEVACRDRTWEVPLGPVAAGAPARARRRLPAHEPCTQYGIGLASAAW